MVWDLHGAEGRRTEGQEDSRTGGQQNRRTAEQEDRRTGEQEDRTFQHYTPHSALPEPPDLVGTGISSVAAHTGDRRSQYCCGVVGRVFLVAWGRVFRHSPCWSLSMQWGRASPAWPPTPAKVPWALVAPEGHGDRTGAPSAAWYVGVVSLWWGWSFWPGWMLSGWDGGGRWGDGCVGAQRVLASGLA